jgi:hypothetical protein
VAYAYLYNQSITSTIQAFQHLRDFLCKRNGTYDHSSDGIGWTLHDSSYATDEDNITAGDWFVVKSTGESGNEQLYLKVEYSSATNMLGLGYMYWNAGTDTGSNGYGYSTGSRWGYGISSTPVTLSIYGDLDHFVWGTAATTGSDLQGAGFGKLTCAADEGPETVGNLSSGSDVSITVADATEVQYAVGNKLVLYDDSNLEFVTIKTNNGSDTLTADLTNSYTSAKIRTYLPYVISGASQDNVYDSGYMYMPITTDSTNDNVSFEYAAPIADTTGDPGLNNRFLAIPMALNITAPVDQGISMTIPNMYLVDELPSLSIADVMVDKSGNNWRYISLEGRYRIVREY